MKFLNIIDNYQISKRKFRLGRRLGFDISDRAIILTLKYSLIDN